MDRPTRVKSVRRTPSAPILALFAMLAAGLPNLALAGSAAFDLVTTEASRVEGGLGKNSLGGMRSNTLTCP